MTRGAFQALPFSSANFFKHLSNTHCNPDEVASNPRAGYLLRYLSTLGARSMVVERHYTDGDYLEDFASYYVRCHRPYGRRCRRLHFFSCDLDDAKVLALVLGELKADEALSVQKSYLGFVVVRPLPSAVVGRTVLKTYPDDGGRRHYSVLLTFTAHLFGTPLHIQSLPFQEQDTVLAACATVALWCAFHKTHDLFDTASPRPAEITRTANRVLKGGRPIPSHSLTIEQMCHVVSEVGLEPELIDCTSSDVPLVSLAYGHLMMGLPVVLGVEIPGRGRHAITLTGFSLRTNRVHAQEVPIGAKSIPMIGLRIDELYAHDDQVGPFSRLVVVAPTATEPLILRTQNAQGKQFDMYPLVMLVPVYNKIRLTFLDVKKWLTRLTGVLLGFAQETSIEWDLHLVTSNEYKMGIKGSSLSRTEREIFLLRAQPRFLWQAILRIDGEQVFELLADATDMERSFPFLNASAIWRHAQFRADVKQQLVAPANQAALARILTPRFLDYLKRNI